MIAAKLLILLILNIAISMSRRVNLSSDADDFKWIAGPELQKYLKKIEWFRIYWKLEDFGPLEISETTLDIVGTERQYHLKVTAKAIKSVTYYKRYHVERIECLIDLKTEHLPADISCKVYHTDGIWNDILAWRI